MKEPEIAITENGGGATFPVRLHPRAGREGIIGVANGRLKIEVAAAPVRDQANRALVRLLRKELGVPQSAVAIVRGAASRDKLVRVEGMTAEGLGEILRGKIH